MDSWGKLTAQTEPQASSWGRGRKLEKPVGVGTRLGEGGFWKLRACSLGYVTHPSLSPSSC